MEDLSDNIIELIDEDGEKLSFILLDYIKMEKSDYIVVTPEENGSEDEESDVYILRVKTDEDGDIYEIIEDDDETGAVFEEFLRREDEFFYEDEEDEEE